MFRTLFILMLVIAVNVACVSSHKQYQERTNATIETTIQPRNEIDRYNLQVALRSIASDTPTEDSVDIVRLETMFEKQMEGADSATPAKQKEIAAGFIEFLNWSTDIYYVAQGFVAEFDKELDTFVADKKSGKNPEPILEKEIYLKLQAVRILGDRHLERLSYLYRRLLETGANASLGTRARTANIVLGTINRTFTDTYSKGDPASMIALAAELDQINKSFSDELKSLPKPPVSFSVPNMARFTMMKPADLKILKQMNTQNKAVIEAREKAMARGLNRVVNGYLESAVKILKENMMFDSARTPQQQPSLSIYPSTGSAGNITGRTFPANVWTLTYDDGPHRVQTPLVLDNLKKHNIRATFFWLSQSVKPLASIVARAKSEGHALANHSYNHGNLPKLGESGLQQQIVQSTQDEAPVYGSQPTLFRCPYGACPSRARQLIADLKMVHVFWNVDTLDWQDKNPQSIYNRSMKQIEAHGRGIILFHDVHAQSTEASRMIMASLKNVRWLTVPQAISEVNGVPYSSP